MSTATPRIVVDNTLGALFIGSSIAMALWGAASVQAYYYFNEFPKDVWWLKLLVAVVWALDTAHQGCIMHACYEYLVSNYAVPTFLYVITPTLAVMVQLSAVICLLVQTFLVYRVWRLSEKNIFLVGGLYACAIAQFVATTVYYAKGSAMLSFLVLPTIAWLSKLSNSLAAATDVCIAITLTFLLNRSRTGFKRSETMINRLILFTINTSVATSVVALFSVIFVSLYPDALIYVGFYVCISKMYTNTLLATLNARRSTREGFAASYNQGSSIIMSRDRTEAQLRSTKPHTSHLAIHVETETMQDEDNIVLNDLERNGGKVAYNDSEHTAYSYDNKTPP